MPALRCDIIQGDNIPQLIKLQERGLVDLVYADPPFNSGRGYNLLVKGGQTHQKAYADTWHWKANDQEAQRAYERLIERPLSPQLAAYIKAQHDYLLGTNAGLLTYLVDMAPRIHWMHQGLKDTGAMVLHCDPTASHYLKALMDCVFGHQNFLSEIIWKRHSNTNNARRPGPIHDVLLLYSKSAAYKWRGGFHKRTTKANVHQDLDGRLWIPTDLTGAGFRDGPSGQPWRGVSPNSAHKPRHWAIGADAKDEYFSRTGKVLQGTSQEMLDALEAVDLIYWTEANNPRLKRYVAADSEEKLQNNRLRPLLV